MWQRLTEGQRLASAPTHKVSGSLAPALPFSSIFRFQKEARDGTLGFITKWAELGGVARFESRLFVAYLVTAPEAVQRILQDNNKNYRKEVRSARVLRIVMGNGLFISEGDKWRAQRKIVQPAFHQQRLAGMAALMVDAIDSMLNHWETFAARGDAFDLSSETSRLALDVVGRTLLGDDLREEAETLERVLVDLFNYLNHALNHFLVAPRFIPTARNRALSRVLGELDLLLYRLIDRSRATNCGNDTSDLLAMLLTAYGNDAVSRSNCATI
jgi:cytochrome P450